MRSVRLAFGLWTALIFALSPSARFIQELLSEYANRSSLALVMLAAGLALGCCIVSRMRRAGSSRRMYVAVAATGLAFVGAGFSLLSDPEEIFHLFEYGVLSFLVGEALGVQGGSSARRAAAALVTGAIGTFEELFQWALPGRVFDPRDVGLNFLAAALVQGCLLACEAEAGRRSGKGDRTVTVSALLLCSLSLLMCTLLNPSSVRSAVAVLPALGFLEDEPVIDFGFMHEIDSRIRFRSHFRAGELRAIDAERGPDVEELLAHRTGDRDAFLREHSEVRDPFLHEAEVHLFRRDTYLRQFLEQPGDVQAAETAFAEERILESAFPAAVSHALLRGDAREKLRRAGETSKRYVSPVAGSLITTVSAPVMELIAAALCAVIALIRFVLGRHPL